MTDPAEQRAQGQDTGTPRLTTISENHYITHLLVSPAKAGTSIIQDYDYRKKTTSPTRPGLFIVVFGIELGD